MIKKYNNIGFTLIELLIVMTIISVLSAVGLIAYNNFLKTSRDSRRQSDLKFIQSALEDFHSDQLYYPEILTTDSALQFDGENGPKTYLNKVPKDPLSIPDYAYAPKPDNCSGSDCADYCLYAFMERLTIAYTDNPTTCQAPLTIGGYTYNYAVTRP